MSLTVPPERVLKGRPSERLAGVDDVEQPVGLEVVDAIADRGQVRGGSAVA